MAKGLPPNKHFKVHFVRTRMSFVSVFFPKFSPKLVLEMVEPSTQVPIFLLFNKRSIQFLYQKDFIAHFLSINCFTFSTTSNQYLQLWHYCHSNWGSDLTMTQRGLNRLKGPVLNNNLFTYVAALVCKNCGVKCPEKLHTFKVKKFKKLIETCGARRGVV